MACLMKCLRRHYIYYKYISYNWYAFLSSTSWIHVHGPGREVKYFCEKYRSKFLQSTDMGYISTFYLNQTYIRINPLYASLIDFSNGWPGLLFMTSIIQWIRISFYLGFWQTQLKQLVNGSSIYYNDYRPLL